jgi:hypothetical protein
MSDYPDEDSEDLTDEEVESALLTTDKSDLAHRVSQATPDGTTKVQHERRRRKPHQYLRTTFYGEDGEILDRRLFRINWVRA